MIFTKKVIKYGDDVSTDLIFPGRYTYRLLTEEEMGMHALEDLDASFGAEDESDRIIVAGKNWGCGSAREQAVKSLKAKGIKVIIAKSIARIYYRNCINEGIVPIVCPEAADALENGDEVVVDVEAGTICFGEKVFNFPALPEFVLGIIANGGLIAQVKKEIENRK